MRKILLFAFCAILCGQALAADGTSFDPSSYPTLARQVGMGGVSAAFARDVNGVFYNPAGLSQIIFPQWVASSRKLMLDETQYNLAAFAVPTDYGTFGIGYVGMGTGNSIPTKLDPATNRIIIDPSREAMSYDNRAILFSYAKDVKLAQLPKNISLGGSLKFLNQSLSGDICSQASGIGLDLGAIYTPMNWLTVGANLQNFFGGKVAWEGGASDSIGGFYKLGCKVNILGSEEALYQNYPGQKLEGGLDIDIPHSSLSSMAYHLGAEYTPLKNIFLRSGFNIDQNGTGLTLGVGFINGGFRFDYAFTQRPGLPGDSPHYFSLSYIGERVVNVILDKKAKRRESAVIFHQPKDRSITDQDFVVISAEARAMKVLDKTTVWSVTSISETKEVVEVREPEDLNPVYLNGVRIDKVGTIEVTSPLGYGRNVFQIVGYVSPEAMPKTKVAEIFAASGEARVLRFIPFKDTPMSYWAIEPIALSVTLELVKGYPDNSFKPEKGITRAELVTLLVRSLPNLEAEAKPEISPYKDVPLKHWAVEFIDQGAKKNLVTGYPDGTFKPNKILTRAEGVTILARYAGLVQDAAVTASPFPDLKLEFWANKYIIPSKAAGMLKYLEGKEFKPAAEFTRAEACEVLYRTPPIQRKVDQFWETGLISAQQAEVREAPKTTTATGEVKVIVHPGVSPEALTKPATVETQITTKEAP